MSFFHRKKKLLIKDPYLVRMELVDDYQPANNAEVKQALADVSAQEKEQNEPILTDTLPFASFKTAEDFLGQLRDIAAENAEVIKFKYFAIWKYDPNEKVKLGEPDSNKNLNPSEFITLNREGHAFQVSAEYENLTKQLFEEIFNDPDNAEISYDDKIDYCKELRQAYLDSTQIDENEVAELPSLADTEKGDVNLKIPAFSTTSNNVNTPNPNTVVADQSPVYDPSTGTFSNGSQAQNVPVNVATTAQAPNDSNSAPQATVVNDQGVRTFDAPVPDNTQPQVRESAVPSVSSANARRSIRKSVEDEVKTHTDEAKAKGHIEAPQFTVKDLDSIEPGKNGYVEYRLDQAKKHFNSQLKSIAKTVSSKNEKAILANRQAYSKQVDEALKKFKQDHAHDDDKIFADIQNSLKDERDTELASKNKQVDLDKDNQLKDAKSAYDKQVQQIEHQAATKKQDNEVQLTAKYTDMAQESFKKRMDEHYLELQDNEDELTHKLSVQYNLKSREDAAQLRASGDDILQKAFDKMNKQLDKIEANAIKENNSAKETTISQQRVENERQRLEAPFDEVRQKNQKITDLTSELSSTKVQRDHFQKIAADNEALLHQQKAKIESLQENVNALTVKNANDKIAKSNDENAEMINKLIAMQLAKSLGTDKQDEEQAESPKQKTNDEQLKTMVKGMKRLTFGFVTLLLIVIAGGAGLYIHQEQVYNQRISDTTRTLKSQVVAAQKAQPKQLGQEEANKKATVALHENSQKKLDKYANEQYYQLDKAIINNDADAANTAVKNMDDLKMNDHYRAAQAQNLLNKAGNYSLANKVGDAN